MSIAVLFVLALATIAAVGYPLFARKQEAWPAGDSRDEEIERAVRALRRSKAKHGPACPSCGRKVRDGDRFCVGCGATLSVPSVAARACPQCGAALRQDDRFCGKCGLPVPDGGNP